MVRTRSFGVKAGGKSSKKAAASSPSPATSAGTSSGSKKNENGNAIQVQPTPAWQREITDFLGNPPKKPRLEDDEDEGNNPTSDPVVEGDKPVEEDKKADNKAAGDAVNGNNPTKEAALSDVSNKVSADSISGSDDVLDGPVPNKKAAKEEDKTEPTEKGSGEGTNGCNKKEEGSKIIHDDLPCEKDGVKVVEKNVPEEKKEESN